MIAHGPTMEPDGRIAMRLDVTPDEYHADPCAVPSLSSSIAKVMLDQSPRHAQTQHPKMGGVRREDSKVFDRGALVHKLVLGKGRDVVVVEAPDWRTKAAQAARDDARDEGKIPVLEDDYLEAAWAAKAIVEQLDAIGIVLDGESEVAIAWQELSGRGPVWCRGMLDHVIVRDRRAVIYDLKTCRSAHPSACARAVLNYGYDVQAAAYPRALQQLMPQLNGRVDFVFIFAEPRAPFAVTPGRLDDVLRTRGEERWTEAYTAWGDRMFAAKREGDVLDLTAPWPAYANGIVTFEAPGWMINAPEIGFVEGDE